MGPAASSQVDVRVTDRKTLIKERCLARKGYLDMQKVALEMRPGEDNCFPFLHESILPIISKFLFGTPLIRCFEVCPLWFVANLTALDNMCRNIDEGFKDLCAAGLALEYARTDWSPVHIATAGIRIDRILIARVTPAFVSKCLTVGYDFSYARENDSADHFQPGAQPNAAKQRFSCTFRCDVHGKGAARTFWVHKDICRFHGDETRVAATQNTTPVCVNDRIEVAVNLFNAQGMVDIPGVQWKPVSSVPVQPRECPIEEELFDWYDLDSFQAQSVERLQIPDFFAPQLQHEVTDYAGLDVAVSRTRLRASQPGVVPQADRILGSRFEVQPAHSPIILPLKRVGLQHDRFTKIQLREGDQLLLYISQGGKMT
mmetsp:Transcript_10126/g.22347  ORF Transcript_10126/g.22347 Transcript_10126/m.22347 type:complete len:372 (-) Transcript_10126:118-1233(-)